MIFLVKSTCNYPKIVTCYRNMDTVARFATIITSGNTWKRKKSKDMKEIEKDIGSAIPTGKIICSDAQEQVYSVRNV